MLSIAGSDSGGGAGIQADLKTIAALGCYGMTAITALTAQNTLGVRAIHPVPLQMLADQIDAVVEDIGVDAVKIGMLHSADTVRAVAAAIDRHALPQRRARSGDDRHQRRRADRPGSHRRSGARAVPQAVVITPNLDEAALLVGRPLRSEADIEAAARQLIDDGRSRRAAQGRSPGRRHRERPAADVAMGRSAGCARRAFPAPNTHGTGCTLSSAIAAHLALGASLPQAVQLAREYVRGALEAGAAVRTGAGSGPLNHSYAPHAMRLQPLR